MERIKRNESFLRFITNSPNVKQRQAILRLATQDQVLAICEIVINFLLGNIDVTSSELNKLKGYKKDLRRLGRGKDISWKEHKKIIPRMGRILALLISKVL